jgi:hypothetical protein
MIRPLVRHGSSTWSNPPQPGGPPASGAAASVVPPAMQPQCPWRMPRSRARSTTHPFGEGRAAAAVDHTIAGTLVPGVCPAGRARRRRAWRGRSMRRRRRRSRARPARGRRPSDPRRCAEERVRVPRHRRRRRDRPAAGAKRGQERQAGGQAAGSPACRRVAACRSDPVSSAGSCVCPRARPYPLPAVAHPVAGIRVGKCRTVCYECRRERLHG